MRVSVIIPVFNGMPHVREAINSALRQGHDDLEVLVIDDGSEDGTARVVEGYAAPVRLLATKQPRSGPAAARNVGLTEATGDVIAFLDADDLWFDNKLREQLSYLEEHPEAGLICSNSLYWYPGPDGAYPAPSQLPIQPRHERRNGSTELAGWLYYELLLKPSTVWTTTVLMKREVFEQVGLFDESLRLGQDYDYWLRASRHTQIHRLAACHALYRQHPDNSSSRPRDVNFELQIFNAAMRRWGPQCPDGRVVKRSAIRARYHRMNFRMGYQHYWRGDPGVAWRSFAASLRWRPQNPKAWAYLLVSSARAMANGGRRT